MRLAFGSRGFANDKKLAKDIANRQNPYSELNTTPIERILNSKQSWRNKFKEIWKLIKK